MPLRLLSSIVLAAFIRGEVYFETPHRYRGGDVTGADLWITGPDWSYAGLGGGSLLIHKHVPIVGPGRFLVPAHDRLLFVHERTVSVWDGIPTYYELPGKGYDEIFTHDAELSEITPSRAGRYLVAERWNDRARGAKLIEFDLHGRVAEYRFPEVIVGDRALGAMHIELLADRCTLLYTLGNDDPAGNRVRRLNICTNEAQSDFASLFPRQYAGAIRQLPSGDVLVANGNAILRFNSSGSLERGYHFPGVTHLALSTDGLTFWAGGGYLDQAELRHFAWDGNSRTMPLGNPGMTSAYTPVSASDLAVVGEWRAAVERRVRIARPR